MFKRSTIINENYDELDYKTFIQKKTPKIVASGFECPDELLNRNLFDFQKAIVRWALRRGKAALFEDTGLGKTLQQLSWANAVHKYTGGDVLILAPLAVSKQTRQEGVKFGIDVNIIEEEADIKPGINITNYEKIHKFNPNKFIGIVLDESSILKSYSGKVSRQIIESFVDTPYKLSCSATPSPNDYTELGQQAEFLNICTINEMLSLYFINDASNGIGWRLKGHSESEFYKWLAEWAILIDNPTNIGFDGKAYNLPKLNIQTHIVEVVDAEQQSLFVVPAETLSERREARKQSLNARVEKAKEIVSKTQNCLIWCDFNDESLALKRTISDSYEIRGSDTPEHKEKGMIGFAANEVKYLISKPSICGFGMNWQNCHDMIFCGLSDSYEQFYQAIRRCWRFGQLNEVNVHVIISEKEINVLNNIRSKEELHKKMRVNMVKTMSVISRSNINDVEITNKSYNPQVNLILPKFI